MTTPKLSLPELSNNQGQYLNANDTFNRIDQLIQAAVVDRLATPPGSPANGALYLIIATATGAWAGKENQLAYWLTSVGAWTYVTPREGMLIHVNDEDVYYKYTGSSWAVFSAGMTNPMTTSGDIIIGGSSGTPQRLAAGTETHVLTIVSGVPAWQAPSGGSGGDLLSALLNAEVSITGATTLTASAFGKLHVCSGTAADYTVTLPAVSGNAGKFIGFRMASGLTKIVTLDPNASELVNGLATWPMMANETAVLYCDGTAWAVLCRGDRAFSGARVSIAGNKSIPNATVTKVSFDTEEYDEGGYINLGVSTTKVTISVSGIYRISGYAVFDVNSTGRRVVRVQDDAGGIVYVRADMPAVAGNITTPACSTDVSLAAGTELNMAVFQDCGGALNIVTAALAIQRLK